MTSRPGNTIGAIADHRYRYRDLDSEGQRHARRTGWAAAVAIYCDVIALVETTTLTVAVVIVMHVLLTIRVAWLVRIIEDHRSAAMVELALGAGMAQSQDQP